MQSLVTIEQLKLKYFVIILYNHPCLTNLYFQFEDAAKEIADEITKPRPEGEEDVQDIQIMLTSKENPVNIRALKVSSTISVAKTPGDTHTFM